VLHSLSTTPNELGSAELTLLVGGTPTPVQATQSYFVYARMAAAAVGPAAQRVTLLQSGECGDPALAGEPAVDADDAEYTG